MFRARTSAIGGMTFFLALLFLTRGLAFAAAPDPARFEQEIAAFEAMDRTNPPPRDAVLFAGSSSFRLWKTLKEDFPKHAVINRGFGGSQMSDLLHFADRMVLPYAPKVILVYEGDNDLAAGVTPETVLAGFQAFVAKVHAHLPGTRIAFVAIKPSPKRQTLLAEQTRANALIRGFAASDHRLAFIDVAKPMLDRSGQPRGELFVEDRLHLNAEGYRLWRKIIARALKTLER